MARPPKAAKKTVAKPTTKTATTSLRKQPVKPAPPKKETVEDLSYEELLVRNFSTLTTVVETMSETLDMLVQKTENMAYHIIATEEILAELVADNGINLVQVNARIRNKIASRTDNQGIPDKSIDVAAAIASPLPRR